uniref:KIB1-4 beta-propeller domain-containing protein n=1 Tax=Oryza meridionalis TaxID=40149 RepID=A0A0E0F003_9ORYZ
MAGGGWSSLPADLLREVSGRLYSDADHLHIHQVCTHWRAATLPVSACRPWVVAGRALQRGLVPIGDYSLRLPGGGAERMDAGLRRAPPGLRHCCGASRGWLALTDDARSPTRLALWEPLSGAEIPLPCLSPITRVSLSGDPLASPGWVAMASQLKGREGQKTLVCRRGDAAWTMLFEHGTSEIGSVVFHGGKVYYIDIMSNIVVCDLDADGASGAKCTQFFHVRTSVSMLCSCDKFHPERGVHLVACDGEVLLVVLRWGGHPSLAEIYKPEWKGNHQLGLGERVMDLGDHSLFVGRGDTFSLSAKEFPAIKRNCVYYADKNYKQQHWISVFHLEQPDVLEEIPYPEELKEDMTNWMPHSCFKNTSTLKNSKEANRLT